MEINEPVIFWDWNGTLLDDARLCVETMNAMLTERGMAAMELDYYKKVFGFPVIDYYKKIGFDLNKESFKKLSVQFIEKYTNNADNVALAPEAEKILKSYAEAGKKNLIVSAMQHDMLIKLVEKKGVSAYFSDIIGIEDIYAAGKSELAVRYVEDNKLNPRDIVFIGDTVHDYEVAADIGCRCILVADGHQSEDRLRATGAEIISTLAGLP